MTRIIVWGGNVWWVKEDEGVVADEITTEQMS